MSLSVCLCAIDTIHKVGARGSSAESFAYETRLLYPTVLYDNGTRNINHVKINSLIKSNVTSSSVSCWYLLVAAELNAEAAAQLNYKKEEIRSNNDANHRNKYGLWEKPPCKKKVQNLIY